MMAAAGNDPSPELPLVLVLRQPSFSLTFQDRILQRYRLLDAVDSPDSTLCGFLDAHARSVRALICVGNQPLTGEILRHLPALELAVVTISGLDHIDLGECGRRGIIVTNAGPAFSEDAADYAVGLFLDVLRRVSAADRYVRAGGLWRLRDSYPLGSKVGGKRVGIVGLGRIGSMVARRLEALGCTIAYTSRKKHPTARFSFHPTALELSDNSDVLVVCCALTGATRHIVDGKVLSALGKEGIIVNVGRGKLVDEAALTRALVGGEIGGAGLDVFEGEPNVAAELRGLDNVVLSPHKAVLTPEAFAALQDLILENLVAFFSNRPVSSKIDL